MNLGYIPVVILTFCGMIIPLLGLIFLYFREQNRTTMCLMITNIGALVMNCGYMLMLSSRTFNEALSLYKIMFVGNPLFYVFFIRFIYSYFNQKRIIKLVNVIFILITLLDLATAAAVWNNNEFAYRDITYRFRQNDGSLISDEVTGEDAVLEDNESSTISQDVLDAIINNEQIREYILNQNDGNERPELPEGLLQGEVDNTGIPEMRSGQSGYIYMQIKGGTLYNIRYMVLSGVLFLSFVVACILWAKQKDKEERKKLSYIICSYLDFGYSFCGYHL